MNFVFCTVYCDKITLCSLTKCTVFNVLIELFVFSLAVIVYRDGYIVLAFVIFACMFYYTILLR